VGDLATLDAWAQHLDALGMTHSGVQDLNGKRGGPLIVLRDPDNIQIELTPGWQPPVSDRFINRIFGTVRTDEM
jgi:glyoxylase I family protein